MRVDMQRTRIHILSIPPYEEGATLVMIKDMQMLIGVDEAGRGPLAGPLAVGMVYLPSDFDIKGIFPGITDSKLLTEKKRNEFFAQLQLFHKRGILSYTVSFVAPSVIDERGLTKAVDLAVRRGIRRLAPDPAHTLVILDGLLHAPREYLQKTIIGGDRSEPAISLASVAAKVARDRRMRHLARSFPEYGFEVHKGYGTKAHQRALSRFGLCDLHRKSFCERFISPV